MTALQDTSWIKQQNLDCAYANLSPAQKLDLYFPNQGAPPYPLIIAIHGGGFIWGDKREDQVNAPVAMVADGFAVAAINYRLAGEAVFPAAIEDCKAAIRFLRAHAGDFGIDADRMAVWGNSAGAYLAVMAAVTGTEMFTDKALGNAGISCAVQAVVDWFGPVDFAAIDAQFKISGKGPVMRDDPNSPESRFFGMSLAAVAPGLLRQSNPLTYLTPGLPPFLIQHGAEDDLVPVEQSLMLAAGLRLVMPEEQVKLDILPGCHHGGPDFETPANMAKVRAFLHKALRLPAT
jgi:acetyl esterase/lipase